MLSSKTFLPTLIIAVLASAPAAVYLLSPARPLASARDVKGRKAAADFVLEDAEGGHAKLSDYRGRVVLINFWATWCGPCNVEVPWFVQFEKAYRDRGFAVLGVSMDEDGWQVVKPYIVAQKINYRVALGNDQVAQLYGGIDSLPTTVLVDREGRVAASHIGLVTKDNYKAEILRLLEH